MKRYLVGGAVRDQLLGLPVKDRDWLVIDTTPEELIAKGFNRVGKEFPIFLHPETKEEHAFPRGAEGLASLAAVEADLQRRDLTVNALALGPNDELIDPCGGRDDLENRVLRHTPAFAEDPIRVLRLARLHARYAHLGFHVAAETALLVREMVAGDALGGLVAERVWAEVARALTEPDPPRFFHTLHELGALGAILPELEALFGVPQPARHHPEIDTGAHCLLVLGQACRLSPEPRVRWAALLHDLGKGDTDPEILPHHYGHERRGAELARQLCQRLRVPTAWSDLAVLAARFHGQAHKAQELRPRTLLRLLNAFDAMRRPERFAEFLLVCEADSRGRTGLEERPYPQAEYLATLRDAAAGVDARAIAQSTPPNQSVAERIHRARLAAIAEARAWLLEAARED
jgi:tRNA nucleotidyltransferase (CCA-adding enzyme)